MSLRLAALLLGLALLFGALAVAGVQVVLLEKSELEHASPWQSLRELAHAEGSTRISARLTSVALDAGEHALFELCARDGLEPARWRSAFDVVVWEPSAQRLELKLALDDAHLARVKRAHDRACLTLGGGTLARSGTYAVDLAWAGRTPAEGLFETPLRVRVLARHPLGLREGVLVLCAALGAMLSVLAAFAAEPRHEAGSRRSTAPFALLGTGIAVALASAVLRAPVPGSIGGLLRGLGLASVEVGVAIGFAWVLYRAPRDGLSLHAPRQHAGVWLFVAASCAALLNPLAHWALSIVPASGEAPIEAFISWPSGALAFAALGMSVPLAEELFFRGFVFGALRPLGVLVASVGSLALFAAAHVQQAWGNWGALIAVLLTGGVLTALRAASGSTLVPAVAHLLYNLSLWKDSFAG